MLNWEVVSLVACLECGHVVDEKSQGNRSQLSGARRWGGWRGRCGWPDSITIVLSEWRFGLLESINYYSWFLILFLGIFLILDAQLFVDALCRGGKPQRGRRIVLKIDHIIELELELVQTHMTQKPLLWIEVGAHAVRKTSECAWVVWAGASSSARCDRAASGLSDTILISFWLAHEDGFRETVSL
jgi:hypothetical protein